MLVSQIANYAELICWSVKWPSVKWPSVKWPSVKWTLHNILAKLLVGETGGRGNLDQGINTEPKYQLDKGGKL